MPSTRTSRSQEATAGGGRSKKDTSSSSNVIRLFDQEEKEDMLDQETDIPSPYKEYSQCLCKENKEWLAEQINERGQEWKISNKKRKEELELQVVELLQKNNKRIVKWSGEQEDWVEIQDIQKNVRGRLAQFRPSPATEAAMAMAAATKATTKATTTKKRKQPSSATAAKTSQASEEAAADEENRRNTTNSSTNTSTKASKTKKRKQPDALEKEVLEAAAEKENRRNNSNSTTNRNNSATQPHSSKKVRFNALTSKVQNLEFAADFDTTTNNGGETRETALATNDKEKSGPEGEGGAADKEKGGEEKVVAAANEDENAECTANSKDPATTGSTNNSAEGEVEDPVLAANSNNPAPGSTEAGGETVASNDKNSSSGNTEKEREEVVAKDPAAVDATKDPSDAAKNVPASSDTNSAADTTVEPSAATKKRAALKRRFSIASNKLEPLLQEIEDLKKEEKGLEEARIQLLEMSEKEKIQIPELVVKCMKDNQERSHNHRLEKEKEHSAILAELLDIEAELKQEGELLQKEVAEALGKRIDKGDNELYKHLYRPMEAMIEYAAAVIPKVYDPKIDMNDVTNDLLVIEELSVSIRAAFAGHPRLADRIQKVINEYCDEEAETDHEDDGALTI